MFPVNASEDRGRFDFWGDMVEQYGEEGADARVKWPSLKGTERAIEKLVRVYEGRAYRLLDICRQSIVFEEPEQLAQCLKQIREDADVEVVAIKNRLTDVRSGLRRTRVCVGVVPVRVGAELGVLTRGGEGLQDYDARALSLGYRDVNINLRIYNERTKKHGINPHICEVCARSDAGCRIATDPDQAACVVSAPVTVRPFLITRMGLCCMDVQVQLLLKSFSEYKSVAGHKRYVAFRNARGR